MTKKTRVAKIECADGVFLIINEVRKARDDVTTYELFVKDGCLPNGEDSEEFFSVCEAMAYAAEIVELTFEETEGE